MSVWIRTPLAGTSDRAVGQWCRLRDTLLHYGAKLLTISAGKGFDAVFCRDIGCLCGDHFLVGRFVSPHRRHETRILRDLSLKHKLHLIVPRSGRFEGGDVLLVDGNAFVGYGQRTDKAGAEWVGERLRALGRSVALIEIIDSRYIHLDLCIAVVDGLLLLVEGALSPESAAHLEALFPHVVRLHGEDAFACNGVYLGERRVYITPHTTTEVTAALRARRVLVETLDCSEFLQESGGVHCLTNGL